MSSTIISFSYENKPRCASSSTETSAFAGREERNAETTSSYARSSEGSISPRSSRGIAAQQLDSAHGLARPRHHRSVVAYTLRQPRCSSTGSSMIGAWYDFTPSLQWSRPSATCNVRMPRSSSNNRERSASRRSVFCCSGVGSAPISPARPKVLCGSRRASSAAGSSANWMVLFEGRKFSDGLRRERSISWSTMFRMNADPAVSTARAAAGKIDDAVSSTASPKFLRDSCRGGPRISCMRRLTLHRNALSNTVFARWPGSAGQPAELHRRQLAHRGGVEVGRARVVDHDRRGRLLGHDLVGRGERRADRVLDVEQPPHDLVLREVGAGAVAPGVALPALVRQAQLRADAAVVCARPALRPTAPRTRAGSRTRCSRPAPAARRCGATPRRRP